MVSDWFSYGFPMVSLWFSFGFPNEGISEDAARQKVRDARNRQVPLRIGGQPCMGNAWDTANTAVFLASEEARFITGAILCVDGGQAVSQGCPVPDRERDS